MYMYCIEKSVNISTRVNNICFIMLLLAMISLHVLTFSLMAMAVPGGGGFVGLRRTLPSCIHVEMYLCCVRHGPSRAARKT